MIVVDMVVHISIALRPKARTPPIIARNTSARIKPYSTAVAPRWSAENLALTVRIVRFSPGWSPAMADAGKLGVQGLKKS